MSTFRRSRSRSRGRGFRWGLLTGAPARYKGAVRTPIPVIRRVRAALSLFFLALLGALPTPRAAADEVPPQAVVGDLPFEARGELNRIYVNLAPDGRKPFVWLLDTGAQASVMTPLAARAARVSVRRQKTTPYIRGTRLGRDLRFWVDTRSSDTGSRTGWEYGLLGGEFLEEYVLELDFPARRVRFLDPRRYRVPEATDADDERVVPLSISAKRPFVEIELEGRRTRVLLDTGAPDNLVLSGRAAKKLGIDWKTLPDFGRYGSTVGPVDVRLHESEGFSLGGFGFASMPVVVAPRGWYNIGGNTDSALGFDVLRQFVVRIDYPRRRLWLKRTGDPRVTYLGIDYELTRASGVFVGAMIDGYWIVGVRPESPGARIGLLPGDRLPATEAGDLPDVAGFLSRVAAEEQIRVLRGDGDAAVDVVLPELKQPRSMRLPPVTQPAQHVSAPPPQRVWLDVTDPEPDAVVSGSLAWIELAGVAAAGSAVEHDVVVVLDVSGSTAYASGVDVDGDGKLGRRKRRIDPHRSFNPRHYSSDPGDTVLAAELAATRRLLELLDPTRTRIGIVVFSDAAKPVVPLGGDPVDRERVLRTLEGGFGSGFTNMGAAIRSALEALAAGGEGRRRSILVLSDGYPTFPGSEARAADEALEAAREAAALGVRIFTFGLGLEELEEDDVYARMASVSGGQYVRLDVPGDVVHELPRVDLASVARVDIENLSTGEAARAPRVFPDGSFDGLVELMAGPNRIRVTARGDAGGQQSLERVVTFEKREPRDAAEAEGFSARAEAFRRRLALRGVETELLLEARSLRERQRRELELRGERQEASGGD